MPQWDLKETLLLYPGEQVTWEGWVCSVEQSWGQTLSFPAGCPGLRGDRPSFRCTGTQTFGSYMQSSNNVSSVFIFTGNSLTDSDGPKSSSENDPITDLTSSACYSKFLYFHWQLKYFFPFKGLFRAVIGSQQIWAENRVPVGSLSLNSPSLPCCQRHPHQSGGCLRCRTHTPWRLTVAQNHSLHWGSLSLLCVLWVLINV